MRTHNAAFDTHLEGYAHTRCNMLLLELLDGTTIGLTDHDEDLDFDLDGDGTFTYYADRGILPSDIVTTVGFDVDNYEVSMPFSDDVTLPAIIGRRFNRARARLFQVNWNDLSQGASRTLYGKVADGRPEGGLAVLEVRGFTEAYNQNVGSVLSTPCRRDFGDSQCGVTRTTFATTVTASASNISFTLDVTGIPGITFDYGSVKFTSGALNGTREVELFTFDAGTGAVELFAPLAEAPAIGDALTLYNGCSKLLLSDDVTIPTCKFYDNALRFDGPGWFAPGTDTYNKYQVPGSSGA